MGVRIEVGEDEAITRALIRLRIRTQQAYQRPCTKPRPGYREKPSVIRRRLLRLRRLNVWIFNRDRRERKPLRYYFDWKSLWGLPKVLRSLQRSWKDFCITLQEGDGRMTEKYTAVIQQHGEWWIGWVEEVRGVNSQGKTREELLDNLRDALEEALEMNRADATPPQEPEILGGGDGRSRARLDGPP
jgi:predicted RNase H-like HicB family nuclease